VWLPDGEGITLLKAVRKSIKYRHIPFLMVTGHSDVDHMIQCSQQGSSDYLVKPFTKDELVEKLV
jgi:DNA-binding response OmpR family regulator